MSDREAFLRAIAEAPEDDAPRLVFADWLEEHGDAERAEFVRLQCRLAALGPEHPDFLNLTIRSNELLLGHERTWLGEWCERLVRWRWRRGFLHAVTVTPGPFLRHGGELFRQHPTVWQVAFVDENGESVSGKRVGALAASPHMAQVRSLDVTAGHRDEPFWGMYSGTVAGPAWCRALARASHVTRLEELFLGVGTLNDRSSPDIDSLTALTRAPHLRTLRVLDIGNREWSATSPADEVVRLLAGAAFADRLESLNLDGCDLAPPELERLTDRAQFPSLRRLHWFTDGYWPEEGKIYGRATHLTVRKNYVSEAWRTIRTGTELDVAFTGSEGLLFHEGKSPDPLSGRVDLPLGPKQMRKIRAVTSSPWLAAVNGLRLSHFSDKKLELLFASPRLRGLESLALDRAFKGAKLLPSLVLPERFPRLHDVVISSQVDSEVRELLRRRFGPRLRLHVCYENY